MNKPTEQHLCVQCSKIFANYEDIPTDTTLVRGVFVNFDGETRKFYGYLCDMHINDTEWVGSPLFIDIAKED